MDHIKPYREDPGIVIVPLNGTITTSSSSSSPSSTAAAVPSRYESQKRRDWNTFNQYLRSHRPPLSLSHCSGAHVLEFMMYLDQFGKTKVHGPACPFFGQPNPPAPCPCPLKQAWGSLDALVGRLRAAFEENGGLPEANPFGTRAVRIYLKDVRDHQSKARGVSYDKKKKKQQHRNKPVAVAVAVAVGGTATNPNNDQEAISATATATAHGDMLLEGLEVPNLSFRGKDSSGFKA